MKTRSRQLWCLVPMVLIILLASCAEASEPPATQAPFPTQEIVHIVVTATADPEAEDAEVPVEKPQPTDTAIAASVTEAETETEIEDAESEVKEDMVAAVPIPMSLMANKATTQHSPRPEPFMEPPSIDEIIPSVNWSDLQPDDVTSFQSYDGVRVLEGGEALLDLGNSMQMTLRHDTEMQIIPGSMVQEELDQIQVDFGKSPILQQVVLAAHLFRGGFMGETDVGSDPIALTTPNTVVLVYGTTFIISYDPVIETTGVINFDGTIDVADVEQEDGDPLPRGLLVTIPPVRDRKYWPLDDDMTPEEFMNLLDQLESPVDAVDMISGPYLVGRGAPDIDVYRGPGTEFEVVGSLAEGEYARIIGQGREWWQIDCPQNTHVSNTDCWVAGGDAYVSTSNTDNVPETAQPASAVPVISTATVVPVIPTATPVPPSCSMQASGPFVGYWDEKGLGCATSGANSIWMAEENFVNGRMYWRDDNDRIYAVYSNGTWASYADIWNEGDPEFSCETPSSPPTPRRGFGKIWCTYGNVRNGLGDAIEAERGENGIVQEFENGFMLRASSGKIYTFYNGGSWK